MRQGDLSHTRHPRVIDTLRQSRNHPPQQRKEGELVFGARSSTWDQGAEMSNHANFTLTTGIPMFFCDPQSPWQRGSRENTIGLQRA
jgi:IS30 family transposase